MISDDNQIPTKRSLLGDDIFVDEEDLDDDFCDDEENEEADRIDFLNDKISAIDTRLSSVEKKVRNLQLAFDWTTNKVVSRERYSKLSDLRDNYAFDEDAEREKCRYNKMTDAQFAKRCEEIVATCRPVPSEPDDKSRSKVSVSASRLTGAGLSPRRLIPVISLLIGGIGWVSLSAFKADPAIVWGSFAFAVVFAVVGYLDSRRDQIDE